MKIPKSTADLFIRSSSRGTLLILGVLLVVSLPATAQDVAESDINLRQPNISDSEVVSPKNTLSFGIQLGAALPSSNYSNKSGNNEQFAGIGFSMEARMNYTWNKWGLGIQVGYFSNTVNDKVGDLLNEKEFDYTTKFDHNRWTVTYLGLGPQVDIGSDRWPIQLYINGGFMWYQAPQFTAWTVVSGNNVNLINYYYSEREFTTAYLSAGGEVGYRFSRNWSIHLNIALLGGLSQNEYLYSYRQVEINGPPPYSGSEIVNAPVMNNIIDINPVVFNLGLGIRYTLGN